MELPNTKVLRRRELLDFILFEVLLAVELTAHYDPKSDGRIETLRAAMQFAVAKNYLNADVASAISEDLRTIKLNHEHKGLAALKETVRDVQRVTSSRAAAAALGSPGVQSFIRPTRLSK